MKRRATWFEFYNNIPVFPRYRGGLEILKELESDEVSIRGMRVSMYRHLGRWEDQGFVTSRVEDVPAGFEGLAKREYARIESQRPEEFEKDKSGLRLILNPGYV